MIDAKLLLQSLQGEQLATVTGRPTQVLEVDGDRVLIGTRRSPDGVWEDTDLVQGVLDRLGAGETISIRAPEATFRSGFIGAVLKTVPQIEFLDGRPVQVRVDPTANVAPAVLLEFERRLRMWVALNAGADANRHRPDRLSTLRIYGGRRGIWVDATTTRPVVEQGGVTVGLKHTGRHYPDDVSTDAMLYHYPVTKQQGHDRNEVDATKAASRLRLPVFSIMDEGPWRRVVKSWVVDWDDDLRRFLVEFGSERPRVTALDGSDDTLFVPFERARQALRLARGRPGQRRFKFGVAKRYGAECAFCPVRAPEMLTAAHIIPASAQGTNDARNGLVLCANHHAAFDCELVVIEPGTTRLIAAEPYSFSDLHVTRSDLSHLPAQPDLRALRYRWERRRR